MYFDLLLGAEIVALRVALHVNKPEALHYRHPLHEHVSSWSHGNWTRHDIRNEDPTFVARYNPSVTVTQKLDLTPPPRV